MKALLATLTIALATPAGATELLANGAFASASASASTTLSGQYQAGPAAASGWNVWNNTDAVTTTEVLDIFQGRSNVLHISSTDAVNGVFQKMYASALSGHADVWVDYGQAIFLAVRDDFGYKLSATSTTGAWQQLTLNTPLPFTEVAFYSWGGAASFYVANASVSSVEMSGPSAFAVPEPATWVMMMLGFGGLGASLRRRSNITTRVRYA